MMWVEALMRPEQSPMHIRRVWLARGFPALSVRIADEPLSLDAAVLP
jgi:hypothetical protein